MENMKVINFTDHEFATYLNKIDLNWTWQPFAEYNKFFDSKGKFIALVKYKNDYPVARKIWLPTPKEKVYTSSYECPCGQEPNCLIYEDEIGPYYLKEDLDKIEKDVKEQHTNFCPVCKSLLVSKMAGGVECSNKNCDYWFCF